MTVRTDTENLDSKPTTGDLREQAKVVRDDLKGLGRTAGQVARDKLDDSREKAATYLEDSKGKVREVEHQVEGYIRRNPLKSVLIAAGTGALLGFLAVRR